MKVNITYDPKFQQRPQPYQIPNQDIRVVLGKDPEGEWVIFCHNNTHLRLSALDDLNWLRLFAQPYSVTHLPPGVQRKAQERLNILLGLPSENTDVYGKPLFDNPGADAS